MVRIGHILSNFFRKCFSSFGTLVLLTVFWLLLNEELSVIQIILGMGGSIASLFYTEKYLLKEEYKAFYVIRWANFLKYVVALLFQIYLSGGMALYLLFTNRVKVRMVSYKSDLDNDFLLCVLAVSITLTPGTVAVDKSGRNLQVLCLHCPKENEWQWRKSIREKLENLLKGGTR